MAKRSSVPLQRFEINLFEGDYDELRDILAPHKIAPGEYIRKLIRRQIRYIQDQAALTHKPVEPINDDLDGLATLSSPTEQSG